MWGTALIVATFLSHPDWRISYLAIIAAVLLFFLGLVGLIRFLYAFWFVKDVVDQPAHNALSNIESQGGLVETTRLAALPAQRDVPISEYPRRTNTKEIVPPPSVTENTTRLLEEPPT